MTFLDSDLPFASSTTMYVCTRIRALPCVRALHSRAANVCRTATVAAVRNTLFARFMAPAHRTRNCLPFLGITYAARQKLDRVQLLPRGISNVQRGKQFRVLCRSLSATASRLAAQQTLPRPVCRNHYTNQITRALIVL